MRPRPLSTRQYLKDLSEALRQQQPPPPNDRDLSHQLRRLLGLALLAIALLFISLVISSAWGYMLEHAIFVGPLAAPIPEELMEARADRLYRVGQSFTETMPDGSQTQVTYRGKWSSGLTPVPGDEYYYRGHMWVWLDRGGGAMWVDP